MKKSETIQVISLLAGNYDSILNKSEKQKQLMINTWQECLGDLDYEVVLVAVKKSIINSEFPPTIADIRKNAIEMINPSTNKTAIEAWNEAYSMICCGLYMTEEQFNTASPEVKKFFGNVRQVKELAQTDTEIVNSVTKGQFLKQYEIIVNREKEDKLIPDNIRQLTQKLAENFTFKQLKD